MLPLGITNICIFHAINRTTHHMLMYIDIVQIEKLSQSQQRRLLLLLRYHMLNIRKTATHVEYSYNKVKLNIAINHWNFVSLHGLFILQTFQNLL